ncbi:hypothetical protein AF332_11370 [Sporosarcina globispora]|uniref:Uncharacterized protein n=1 Tax=Sporosarcina globispora TaxID=1459 RepID=A0A0M0GBZ3_SPOGL|nr:AAA family ATPase [Sporosarcina globispora]KON87364.1 hypothetical protein AF332_11370 [Sporosarcina globispora]
MEEIIELKIVPVREFFHNNDYGIYVCETDEPNKVMLNKFHNNFSMKGNTFKLKLDKEYNAKLVEREDKKYGTYYEIVSIFENMPTGKDQQRGYLLSVLTEKQVNAIYKAYPDEDIIELFKTDKFDVNRVKGIGEKSYVKVRDKIIENLEFQQAFEFLSQYGVTNNLIIKLVKHFKSAGLLIKKMKENPYSITDISGIGYKKADTIAMSMGYDPSGEFRIDAAIEYVVEEESNKGNTYVTTDKLVFQVEDLISVAESLINNQIKNTSNLIVSGDRVALKKNYDAEKFISKKLKSILKNSSSLNFDVEKFILDQEEKRGIKLTDQQKSFFYNIKDHNVNLLVGYAGTGKSQLTALLIDLLEQLKIGYKLTSPTGKAAKVVSNYTNRTAETLHRAIGLGREGREDEIKYIEEEFVIVDETSMVDVQLCSKLLKKCNNENLRILFIGDDFQIASIGAGRLLYDLIQSNRIPTTKIDIVFRQKENSILDIATKIRQGKKFLNNSDEGIFKFSENCIVASVPQDKMEGGYKYYLKEMLNSFSSDEITITTPTKKSKLGTVEINKHTQESVNPNDGSKIEKQFGYDGVVFREGDLVINAKNTYRIQDIHSNEIDIVNGDVGKIIKIDLEEEEIWVDFDFATIPFDYAMLGQLLHCWSMTIHKMQGSSNKAICVIADKAHKFQLNANLLYTAVTRSVDYLVILSQASTINFALKKIASLQRDTFLGEFLREDGDA